MLVVLAIVRIMSLLRSSKLIELEVLDSNGDSLESSPSLVAAIFAHPDELNSEVRSLGSLGFVWLASFSSLWSLSRLWSLSSLSNIWNPLTSKHHPDLKFGLCQRRQSHLVQQVPQPPEAQHHITNPGIQDNSPKLRTLRQEHQRFGRHHPKELDPLRILSLHTLLTVVCELE